jgi:hypothetical protein
MNAITLIQTTLTTTKGMLPAFLVDLSDADLLVRPTSGANHIAWQLGHVILAERRLGDGMLPNAKYPDLPAGFLDKHGKTGAAEDSGFFSKDEYLRLFAGHREATLASVSQLTEADLDRPTTGPVVRLAPTLGAVLLLIGNHNMLHAGQFSVVRRKLGKPVLF